MRRCEVCFAPLPSWAEAYLWPCVRGGLTVCADCFDTLVSGLSRRELATRQRILKDSHCGAFAVIGMVLLALCQWSVFLSGSADESLWGLLLIPVATRACAGLAVLKLRPMGTSQYAAMGRHGGYAAALAVLGYSTQEVQMALKGVDVENLPLEEIIRQSLKKMVK